MKKTQKILRFDQPNDENAFGDRITARILLRNWVFLQARWTT